MKIHKFLFLIGAIVFANAANAIGDAIDYAILTGKTDAKGYFVIHHPYIVDSSLCGKYIFGATFLFRNRSNGSWYHTQDLNGPKPRAIALKDNMISGYLDGSDFANQPVRVIVFFQYPSC